VQRQLPGSISPLFPLGVLLITMDLLAVPYAFFFDRTGVSQIFFLGVDPAVIWRAYWWTLYAVIVLFALHRLMGTRANLVRFQHAPMRPIEERRGRAMWWWFVAGAWLCVGVFWIQTGFTIPVLQALGQQYEVYQVLRTDTREAVNQFLFNAALYLLATPALLLSLTVIRERRAVFVLGAAMTVLAVCAFTLARSPLALTGLVAVNYVLLAKPQRARFLLPGVGVFALALLVNHIVAGNNPEGYRSIFEYVGARIVFGEWASLPHFFELYSNHTLPLRSLFPPELQALVDVPIDSPSRRVLIKMVPDVVESRRGGVANTFFIGDALAVAGIFGVLLAPLWAALQYWFVSNVMLRFPKTPLTTFFFAWVLFKLTMAILGGFSALLISSVEIALVALLYLLLARQAAAIPSLAS
jgi:hypothetical protein